ncbi:4-hydroxy-2-oxovalerate aldolase [Trichinella spiralis]|uniref:4-hydroxy-2-oxovalerate aldolase n=1 Tax=Trichinella spiralis TaxID=6334 RepID=UPI0001EFE80A|nr:4-hydroxy-2-oxovalerate aldolase [Trichinella spiralis]XP_003370459.1 4-hydroxy-2-oxovalerate aldolase [Trichinella spiralis]
MNSHSITLCVKKHVLTLLIEELESATCRLDGTSGILMVQVQHSGGYSENVSCWIHQNRSFVGACQRVVDKIWAKCVDPQKFLKLAETCWVDDVLHVPPQRRDYRQQ